MLTKAERKRKTYERYVKNNPWSRNRQKMLARCKHNPAYNGERRKIEVQMTMKDVKNMWFRDKAYLMKQPSINREDTSLHYSVDNCCFMELNENQRQPRDVYPEKDILKGRWSIHYPQCIICGTTKSTYASRGRCKACYQRKPKWGLDKIKMAHVIKESNLPFFKCIAQERRNEAYFDIADALIAKEHEIIVRKEG